MKTGVSEVIDQGSAGGGFVLSRERSGPCRRIDASADSVGRHEEERKDHSQVTLVDAEQLPVTDFRMSRRRLGPGERADGVVVFRRPSFKQSTETLFLQMAESGAVDRPALAPIGFGISSFREVNYDAR